MTRYRGNVEAVRNLVRETEVHRDVYIDDEVFQLLPDLDRSASRDSWATIGWVVSVWFSTSIFQLQLCM